MRGGTEKLKKASAQYQAQIAELKRQVAALQKEVTNLVKMNSLAKPVAPEIDVSKTRWSPRRLKARRERLEMSAEKFGKLFNVSGQTIYNWEGGTRLGKEHLAMIAQVRKLGKRQAHAIVDTKV